VNWPKQFWRDRLERRATVHIRGGIGRGGAPRLIPFGLKMVAPVLMAFGTPEQQRRFLPPILSSESWWCQGYSEPGAGSDLRLAAHPRSARREYFVVNGQKTWNTLGHFAD